MLPKLDADVMLSRTWRTIQSLNHAIYDSGGRPLTVQYLQTATLTEFLTLLSLNSIQFVFVKKE